MALVTVEKTCGAVAIMGTIHPSVSGPSFWVCGTVVFPWLLEVRHDCMAYLDRWPLLYENI